MSKSSEPGTALAPVELGGDLAARVDALLENTGGHLDVTLLPRIAPPAAGGTMWEWETLGQQRNARDLDLIILANAKARAYWSQPMGEGDVLPDCSSRDAITGTGDPGGKCALCPNAQWGSSPKGTRGQACREFRVLPALILPDLSVTLLRVPPTSTRAADAYVQDLALAGLRISQVITRATLVKAANDQGIAYSEIGFAAVGRVETPEHLKAIGELATMVRAASVGQIVADTALADA